jgi:putative addiction module CopG family antidote
LAVERNSARLRGTGDDLLMTIHLPEALESFLHSQVSRGAYASIDEAVADAVRRLMQTSGTRGTGDEADALKEGEGTPQKPIWEIFEEESRSVPPEVWDDLPTDLAEQHDHYIYGGPKKATG